MASRPSKDVGGTYLFTNEKSLFCKKDALNIRKDKSDGLSGNETLFPSITNIELMYMLRKLVKG